MSSLAQEYDDWQLPPRILGAPAPGGGSSGGDGDPRHVFEALVATWRKRTMFISSTAKMVQDPAYQQIIGLGPQAVPWLLQELADRPDHWAWALQAITRQDPAADVEPGDVQGITRAWLRWGRERGLLPERRAP